MNIGDRVTVPNGKIGTVVMMYPGGAVMIKLAAPDVNERAIYMPNELTREN